MKFLHTGDWQLGMTRHFLSDEAQARFTQARFDAIRTIAKIVADESCEFVVVAGDVFESNQVNRMTVARALEAMSTVPVPIYLLPGNHDALDAGSVYRQSMFTGRKPSNVFVLEDTRPIKIGPGVEIVGGTWNSKRPLRDLVASACVDLAPVVGMTRIFVGHGCIDCLSPDPENPALISLSRAEEAIEEGKIQHFALGDRHSKTSVGTTGRIWYAGAPEPTDYDEIDPGSVLIVEVGVGSIKTKAHRVATWDFLQRQFPTNSDADLNALKDFFASGSNKERTILKLSFEGTLTLRQNARLESVLEDARQVYAAIEVWERETHLSIIPDDEDFAEMGLSGFADSTVKRLRELVAGQEPEASTARDALALLVRLSGQGQ